jgi:hypothetical protein
MIGARSWSDERRRARNARRMGVVLLLLSGVAMGYLLFVIGSAIAEYLR